MPHVVQRKYPTMRAGQRSVSIRIVEGESANPANCSDLGVCQITDLPAGLRQGETVVVQYGYESNGLISVSARMPAVRRSAMVEIRRAQTTDLDSLDAWRARILRSTAEAQSESSEPPGPGLKRDPLPLDRQQQLSRLDDLYVLVG